MWHDRSRLKLEGNGQSRSLKRTVRQSHVISRLFENDLYWFVAKVWVVFGLSLTLVEDVEDVEVQRPKLDPSCFGKRHTCCCWLFVNLISHHPSLGILALKLSLKAV